VTKKKKPMISPHQEMHTNTEMTMVPNRATGSAKMIIQNIETSRNVKTVIIPNKETDRSSIISHNETQRNAKATPTQSEESSALTDVARKRRSSTDPIRGQAVEATSSMLVCEDLVKQERFGDGTTYKNMCPVLEKQAAWMDPENACKFTAGLVNNAAFENMNKRTSSNHSSGNSGGAMSQSCIQLGIESERRCGPAGRGEPEAKKESVFLSCSQCCRRCEEVERLKEELEQTESTVVWQSLMIRLYQMNP